MNSLLYPGFLVLIGIFGLTMAIRFLVDKKFGEKYIKESPKAYIWRKIFGEEKAYQMTKLIFAPLGIIISSVLIIFGAYEIIKTMI